jgi:hypothetical protein
MDAAKKKYKVKQQPEPKHVEAILSASKPSIAASKASNVSKVEQYGTNTQSKAGPAKPQHVHARTRARAQTHTHTHTHTGV